jgi:NAD(P)-dependent dehydrogenase (short-subunit alcohol dehydrogenase family)
MSSHQGVVRGFARLIGILRFFTNVGYTTVNPTLEITADDCCFMMSTDFFEYLFHSYQLFAHPLLTAWADGCIVSISSSARVVGVWPGIVYAGAKGMLTFCAHDSSASTC